MQKSGIFVQNFIIAFMNGIYLHLPFCKSRCIYCGFYSTLCGEEVMEKYVNSLCNELYERRNFLPNKEIDTIYLGGGTPSRLPIPLLHKIFDTIPQIYQTKPNMEITIEVNPDDVTPSFVSALQDMPINRISMGIQSFNDDILRFLQRRHTAQQATNAVNLLHNGGINNISIDLIYGLPGQTLSGWQNDVNKALQLPIQHLSSYSLMFEEDTPLKKMQNEQKVHEADERQSLLMYEYLISQTKAQGWEHYEISNFAKPGFRSRHNSGYWQGMAYLGCGASAHSFDGKNIRCWNVADVHKYISATNTNQRLEQEILTTNNKINERIMTSLRTCEGIQLQRFEADFGTIQLQHLLSSAKSMLEKKYLKQTSNTLKLTRKGLFVSDMIMSELMTID